MYTMGNSNNHPMTLINTNQKKDANPDSILKQVEAYGLKKVKKSFAKSFSLAIFAGAFIAIAFVFYITVTTGAHGAPWGIIKLAGGLAFSLGLILVVVCEGELFTSTVLSTVAWAQGHFTTGKLLKCWGRVYLGNLVGAAIMLTLVITARMHLLDGGEWGINAMEVAQHKLGHTWAQAFSLGILCNLLVCLGTWMTFSSKDTLAKSVLLILPVAMFVSSGFEHSIANMFMVPLGITIKTISDPAFFISHGFTPADFAELTPSNFVLHNLIPVTLGNIVGGGVFVGIGYWLIGGETKKANANNTNKTEKNSNNNKLIHSGEAEIMKNALKNLTIKDIMDKEPLVFLQDKGIYQALAALDEHGVNAAPIVDKTQQLVGFVSQQDILRLLWSEEYSAQLTYQVSDAMQTEILTVDANQNITALLEFMVVDKNKLFPVNDNAMLTSNSYQSYEERLKSASANRPSLYPVIEEGKLCGIVTRQQLTNFIVKEYHPNNETQTAAA